MHKIYFIRIKNKLIFYLVKARASTRSSTRFELSVSKIYHTNRTHTAKKKNKKVRI